MLRSRLTASAQAIVQALVIALALLAPVAWARSPRQQPLTLSVPGAAQLELWDQAGKPLVIFVHGGGWMSGDMHSGRRLAQTFLDAGFAFASVEYRKFPDVSIAMSAEDVAAAVNFAVRNARASTYDGDRIAVIGHSAGAHLAALAALKVGLPSSVRALVLLDGSAYDFKAQLELQPGLARRLSGAARSWEEISPTRFAAAAPRGLAFFIAAGADWRGTAAQARTLAEALQEAGVSTVVTRINSMPHTAFVREFAGGDTTDFTSDVLAFLSRSLGRD